ncbi:LysR family transcriptional regulator [Marinicella meishanensis]|uniref:LysR family transcriptional regulator n=1 Tax=Marinicella meishanensis TaxID=2873263 RepID=UPI001CBF1EDC|nr:LysR family transcriptional regulator [Marinicella sp. NBU2979]
MNFNWNHAKAFLKTVETGSLSAAAVDLGMTQPTLGRQVTALEEELGVVLFERVGRGLVLTPNGEQLLDHVRKMAQSADHLSMLASGQNENIAGKIIITATDVMAFHVLPSIIIALRRAEPELSVEVIASNSASDLLRREADIALRAFRPTEPELIGRKLRDDESYLYAANTYLQQLGNPDRPDQFSQANFLGFKDNQRYLETLRGWGFALHDGHFSVICESLIIHWQMVLEGAGVGVMAGAIGDHEPRVRRIVPTLPPFISELWLVTHRELKTNLRVRRVFDFLAHHLST